MFYVPRAVPVYFCVVFRTAGTVVAGPARLAVGATRRATVASSASTRTGCPTCTSVPLDCQVSLSSGSGISNNNYHSSND